MKRTLTAAVLGLTVALALPACGEDEPAPITSTEREKASSAALGAAEGGTVTAVDRADEDDKYAYEVEIKFDNGADLELELDKNFKVLNPPPQN